MRKTTPLQYNEDETSGIFSEKPDLLVLEKLAKQQNEQQFKKLLCAIIISFVSGFLLSLYMYARHFDLFNTKQITILNSGLISSFAADCMIAISIMLFIICGIIAIYEKITKTPNGLFF